MKVAVIGGGFSGMLAAYLLEKEGIDVTVYEKQEYIGGHCKTLMRKDVYTDLGTVCSFSRHIKELLIELQVDYTERFIYRSFINEDYHYVEHMLREDVVLLIEELKRLKKLLQHYEPYLDELNYGAIPCDLMLPIYEFLANHNFRFISQVLAPHLSAFGFGSMDTIQAYYVFKAFNVDTLYAFIRGEKVLFINKGTTELIQKLSQRISDIRYTLEVTNVEVTSAQVKVDTLYGSDLFDKVLITTKLPRGVIKDTLYNELMKKIDTNPFISCAYEVANTDLVTTYFKANLGKVGKVQFFYSSKQNNRTILVAYAYGKIKKDIIDAITHDLTASGIQINHLITVKQWYIFPHLKAHNLTPDFYEAIQSHHQISPISLIGSLVTKPSIDHLYLSVKNTVRELI